MYHLVGLLPENMLKNVMDEYEENDLAYHNWSHILDIFTTAKVNNIKLTHAQSLAIIFHDIVYKVGNEYNEEESALRMLDYVQDSDIPNETLINAYKIIMDTRDHESSIEESKVVLDLDMSHLALDKREFLAYREKIKEECSHISDAEFYQGEIVFFQSLLDKEQILHTDIFSEETLRKNLRYKIEQNKSYLQ